jgi:multisubunit Na+/H+ antiporter MnhB subunit
MRRPSATAVTGVAALAAATGPVAAHAGSIEAATSTPPVPTWFIAMTAGVVVGTSFLFTSLMADHETLELINSAALRSRLPTTLTGAVGLLLRGLSVLGLVAVVGVGLFGPSNPQANAATLAVWVGWWGAFTMSAYLLGNAWPAVDPFRMLAAPLSRIGRGLDVERLGAWPAVVGVLTIVWLEIATAVTANPRWLSVVVLGYAVVVVVGSLLAGPTRWFEIDPLTWIFRIYGRFAPVQRTETGLELRLPGAALTDSRMCPASRPSSSPCCGRPRTTVSSPRSSSRPSPVR